ncbi:DUF1003 domain-containing protein [Azospirillum sp. RWY-5-1]|uniref:DUF1003 domain-containing protein n=1 Tax=Azospirillum oleiclasticum TaxID=2735135 RepID=A0ABX2T5D2_9PROT|nr:DUF1003 domain-containing protein [Azospirillum oleiclasticum]NYZ12369.1 DUF1003 domain-containing protein [Azospirillum oleiclasticum]NYZ19529.1 DUF1003 domain-containing protein [Azospirillum oleiclasticum]
MAGDDATEAAGGRARCAITGVSRDRRDLVALGTMRPSLVERIRKDHPDLPADALIDREEAARYRALHITELLEDERGELTELDRRVAESIAREETLAENPDESYEDRRTFGERLSDKIATFGGSWWFLSSFGGFLFFWIAWNAVDWDRFDPYPFILLNLLLSCLAAVQAPIIMMSQRRQEAKDRLRSENDYRVNLKAELEIRHLHEKMDYLILRQWERLAEIQHLQMEIIRDGKRSSKPE